MKKWCYLGVVATAGFFSSCRPSISEPKNFPTADSYSPGIAKTGDTVTVFGSYLKDSKILIGSQEPTLITNTDGALSFVVTDAMTSIPKQSVFSLSVNFADGTSTKFTMPLVLNHVISAQDKLGWLSSSTQPALDTLKKGPAQILMTDFDGHGFRTANATDRFDQTQWSGLVKVGGSILISPSFLGAKASPAGGNYLAMQINPNFIEDGASGFMGEFISRTELQNDRATSWPSNFSKLPNSPIKTPTSRAEMAQIYFNFYVYKNNKSKGLSDIYLLNDDLALKEQFRFRPDTAVGLSDWQLVSIPFRDIKSGFGFGTGMTFTDYKDINKIKFTFTHYDKKDEDGKNPVVITTDEAQIYIDHVIITQGGPYLAYSKQ